MPSKQALLRITKRDMNHVQSLQESGIYVIFDESDIMQATALILGPRDTPYAYGALYFRIRFPNDYPFSPPHVSYISTSRLRIHPNLYVGKSHNHFEGKVCLSIINTWSGPRWTTTMDLSTVLLSIQSILTHNPIKHEPGYERAKPKVVDAYNHIVTYDTFRQLIIKNSVPFDETFQGFDIVLKKHFKENAENIWLSWQKFREGRSLEYFKLNIYGLQETLDYDDMTKKIKSWIQTLE